MRSGTDEVHGRSQDGETQDYPWLGIYVKYEWQQP
jgi:hypothetical protein